MLWSVTARWHCYVTVSLNRVSVFDFVQQRARICREQERQRQMKECEEMKKKQREKVVE